LVVGSCNGELRKFDISSIYDLKYVTKEKDQNYNPYRVLKESESPLFREEKIISY